MFSMELSWVLFSNSDEPISRPFFPVLFARGPAIVIMWWVFSFIHSFLNLCYGISSLLRVGVASNLTNLFSSFHVFSGSSKIGIIIASILSAIALSMFALFGALLGYKRISQKKKGTLCQKSYIYQAALS